MARAAHDSGRRVTLDPAQEIFYRWDRRTFRAALAASDIVFGNRAELGQASSWVGGQEATRLLEHVPLVVRTEGRAGATAFFRGGAVHAPAAPPRRQRTLVGAGDAFRGGFYGGWFRGEGLADCLVSGNASARSWIEGER